MIILPTVGERLLQMRLENGINVSNAANILGISRPSVYRIEKGDIYSFQYLTRYMLKLLTANQRSEIYQMIGDEIEEEAKETNTRKTA